MISSVKQSVKQEPELLESRFSVANSPLSRHIAARLVRSQREVLAGIVLDRPVLARTVLARTVLARTVSRLSSLHMSPISRLAPSITTARVRSALRTLPAAIGMMVLYAVITASLVEPVAAQSKPHQVTADSTASAPKQHQATGDVATSAPAQLVILKQFGRNKVRWTFVTSPKTKLDGKAAKGARVRIFYHEEKGQRVADRIKIMELAPESSASASAGATASSSAPRSVSPTKTAAPKSTTPKASTTKAAAPNVAALSPSASKTAALKVAAPKTTTPASKVSPAPPSASIPPPAPATQ